MLVYRYFVVCNDAITLPACLSFMPHRTSGDYRRRCSQDWWERVVMREFTDAEWRENFLCKSEHAQKFSNTRRNRDTVFPCLSIRFDRSIFHIT